jgi:peptidoglycan/xylan/chitin deacetylase (PgdA/CDA1 family)
MLVKSGNHNEGRKLPEGNPRAIKVFMYHQIADCVHGGPELWYRVPVDLFRKQIECFDRWGYTTITFEDYRLYREGVLNLPKKPIILTFDDGYLDNYRNAFPILQEYGMKAVMFVLGNRQIKSNNWDAAPGESGEPLMNDRQILDMHEAGFEIGAHSHSHARLTEVSTEVAWKEIYYSRMSLEGLLNAPVKSFAYPYGGVNAETKRMVMDAGYSNACSVFSGPPLFDTDSFEIRRTAVLNSTGLIGMGLRLLAPYQQYEWLRWKNSIYLKARRRNTDRHPHPAANPDPQGISLARPHE